MRLAKAQTGGSRLRRSEFDPGRGVPVTVHCFESLLLTPSRRLTPALVPARHRARPRVLAGKQRRRAANRGKRRRHWRKLCERRPADGWQSARYRWFTRDRGLGDRGRIEQRWTLRDGGRSDHGGQQRRRRVDRRCPGYRRSEHHHWRYRFWRQRRRYGGRCRARWAVCWRYERCFGGRFGRQRGQGWWRLVG